MADRHPLLDTPLEDVIFTFFDTETTGDNVKRVDKPIEIAAVRWNYKKGFLGLPWQTLVDPQMPIHPAAIAVHGLQDHDVEGQRKLEEVLPELHEYIKGTVLVAHNIEFDLNMLPTLRSDDNLKIDSLRFVRHIFKVGEAGHKQQDLRSHKMQELRWWLNLNVDTMGLEAHRAAADILVTGEVFAETMKRFIERTYSETIEDMIQFIESPIMIEKMAFGKYKDVLITDAISQELKKPKNYFAWLLKSVHKGNMTIDDDLKFSIEYYLKQHDIDPKGLLMEESHKNWKEVTEALDRPVHEEAPEILSPAKNHEVVKQVIGGENPQLFLDAAKMLAGSRKKMR